MKKKQYFLILIILLMPLSIKASDKITYLNIQSLKFSINNKDYKDIPTYNSYQEFLSDYNQNNLPDVYLTNFLFDGVSQVKSPDLDDFLDNKSNDIKIKTLEIKVLNINATGNFQLTGTNKGMMIAVNTNNLKGELNLILDNLNLDTDTKKAPVIYIYNKDITYTDCQVTIKTVKDSKNYLVGGKFKKVSLMPSDELNNYTNYYQDEALADYQAYSSYYGIYSKDELNNILFATIQADNEDLKDGDPYYFYKGSGAISSDIDLNFFGEGYLKVTSKNKEGIETKGNLTFSGGVGDYEIIAKDDCLNTTTSNNIKNARNTITISVNSLIAIVDDDGDEGDAIDSNGSLIINNGNIYALAHSESEDTGLDSETGTYINGGLVISTGNMPLELKEVKTNYLYVTFNQKIKKDTLLIIKDENDKVITAFQTSKDITTLFYNSKDLKYKTFSIYSGESITGENTNGLYTSIDDYQLGEKVSYRVTTLKKAKDNFILKLLIAELISIIILISYIIYYYLIKKPKLN